MYVIFWAAYLFSKQESPQCDPLKSQYPKHEGTLYPLYYVYLKKSIAGLRKSYYDKL